MRPFFPIAILLLACGGTVASSPDAATKGTCPTKPVGETCDLGQGGLLPTDMHECEHGLYCRFTTATAKSGVCTALAPVRAPCDPLFVYCVSGAMCMTDPQGRNGVCVGGGPIRQDHAEGEPCSDDPMSVFVCGPGLRCVSSVCRRC